MLAVCRVTPFPFGNLKVAFDVLLVGVASLLSLLCLHGLYGVREGTLARRPGGGAHSQTAPAPLAGLVYQTAAVAQGASRPAVRSPSWGKGRKGAGGREWAPRNFSIQTMWYHRPNL